MRSQIIPSFFNQHLPTTNVKDTYDRFNRAGLPCRWTGFWPTPPAPSPPSVPPSTKSLRRINSVSFKFYQLNVNLNRTSQVFCKGLPLSSSESESLFTLHQCKLEKPLKNHRCQWLILPGTIDGDCENFQIPSPFHHCLEKNNHRRSIVV